MEAMGRLIMGFHGSENANRCGRVYGLDKVRHGDGYALRGNVSRASENESGRGYGRGRVQHGRGVQNMPCQPSLQPDPNR